jgi:serine/threonine protein kinase
MPFLKQPNAEPIPGYRLIEPLGKGGFGEVWKCEAPGGLFKAIKFVYGKLNGLDEDSARAEEELRAVQRIKAIRHPFLLSMDRVESIGGELVIVTELADKNLHDVLTHCQQAGLPGIPRTELLGYLREAAEVLDLMNLEHGLQHLDVKPRNLFLVSNHLKVADFGLVNRLGGGKSGRAARLGAVTPGYASPEVFHGRISRFSDQYSLAIVYQELLTGTVPFRGKNVRQLLLLHTRAEPDLSAVPAADRPALARALAKNPDERFPTCAEFVHALLGSEAPPVPAGVSAQAAAPGGAGDPAGQADTDPTVGRTVGNPAAATETAPAPQAPRLNCPALAGHRFLARLSSSPLVDVWRVEAPDGRGQLVKLVYGLAAGAGRREEEAVRLLRSLHHPGLVHAEGVHREPGRLVLLTDLVPDTLRDRCRQCQAQKLPGIPPAELLDYLRAAAEVLDYFYQQYTLQHLGLNPRNLVLDQGQFRITDFGLAQLFWIPAGQPVAQRNTRYCAPELFDNAVSRSCDQYSLALVYHEMLTGVHAFRTEPGRAPAGGRPRGTPDLSRLPPGDRDVLARALDDDPARRWPDCTTLVAALAAARQEVSRPTEERPDRFATIVKAPAAPVALPPISPESLRALNRIVAELLAGAGGDVAAPDAPALPALSAAGDVLRYQFTAGLPLGAARTKLEAFRQQWYGQVIRDDGQGLVFHVSLPANFWRQWIGRQPGLEVRVRLARHHALSATPVDVAVEIRPYRCSSKRGAALLQEMGTTLLEGLRACLLVNAERRTQDRLLWPHPLRVCPVAADGTEEEPVECRGKDISLSGMGLYLPHALSTSQVCIYLPTPAQPRGLALPATLVRAQRCADGWYEVGALFRLAALRQSRPELCVK